MRGEDLTNAEDNKKKTEDLASDLQPNCVSLIGSFTKINTYVGGTFENRAD